MDNYDNFFNDIGGGERTPVYHTPDPIDPKDNKSGRKFTVITVLFVIIAIVMCIAVLANVIVLAAMKSQISQEYASTMTNAVRDEYLKAIEEYLEGKDISDDVLTAIQSAADDAAVNRTLQTLVAKGPASRRNTLAYLMKYLSKMVKDSSVSLMDPSNLAIVLTPALFPRTDSVASGSAMKAVECMIQDFETIFREAWCNDSVVMTDKDIEFMAEPDVDIEDAKIESLKREIRARSRITTVSDDLCEVLGITRPTREAPPLPSTRASRPSSSSRGEPPRRSRQNRVSSHANPSTSVFSARIVPSPRRTRVFAAPRALTASERTSARRAASSL